MTNLTKEQKIQIGNLVIKGATEGRNGMIVAHVQSWQQKWLVWPAYSLVWKFRAFYLGLSAFLFISFFMSESLPFLLAAPLPPIVVLFVWSFKLASERYEKLVSENAQLLEEAKSA